MKLETFFEKFDELSDIPDGVKSMRELVLRLAFRGGLTGHRPTDEGVPDGWEMCTIESISASISSGFACSRSHQVVNGHVHLRTHNISTLGTLNFDLLVRIDPKMVDRQKDSIRAGDILFNNTNSQELVGKTCLVDRDYDYGFSNHITRIRLKDGLFPGFVVFYLTLLRNSGYFARLCTRWINQAAVNTDTLKQQTIPIPPLAEQKRIVAKVDELMALCDRLEEQQQERETRHAALARASLARFADAPTPANLEYLFHPSYTIPPADLRKSILTLAVQGKLVPPDSNDEPANELVARVATEKNRLVQAKEIKSETPLDPISDEEIFPIPDSWTWRRAGDLCRPISSGSTPDQSVFHSSEGVPYLKVYNIRNQAVDFDYKRQFIAVNHHQEKMKRSKLFPGDVIMNIVGPPLGKVAIVPKTFPKWNCNQAISFFRPIFPEFAPFLYTFLKEGSFLQNIQLIGTAGQDNISVTKCKFVPVPIPPLAEQRRIVARVEQLMALVDELETQLTASLATAANLLSALVAELTSSNAKQ
jgi:type I restriction enzyme S subunit